MEQDARRGLKLIRRYAGTTLVPACEHMLILLQELQGCAQWPERFASFLGQADVELAQLVGDVQTCHAVAIALQEQTERELLALDEFYKWWRMGTSLNSRRTRPAGAAQVRRGAACHYLARHAHGARAAAPRLSLAGA